MNDDEMEAQMEYWKSKAKAAEAERDHWKQQTQTGLLWRERCEAAEAEVARLRECVQVLEDDHEGENRELQLLNRAEAAEAECKSLAAERRETVAEWEREGLRMSAENRRLREALAEVKQIKDAAQWLVDNRGHRGEEQAWKLLEKALTDKNE